MEVTDQPKRRGRPPTGKRGTFTFRVSEKLRADLIAAAGRSRRPVSEEIELRLEQSFLEEKMVGGAHNLAAGRLIAQTLSYLDEKLSGEDLDKEWINNERRKAILKTVEIHFGQGPGLLAPSEEHEQYRRMRDSGEIAAEIVASRDASKDAIRFVEHLPEFETEKLAQSKPKRSRKRASNE